MKIVAAVFADFAESFLGGPSHLTARIGTRTVLAHTLARLARVEGLAARCLFVRPRDTGAAAEALRDCGCASDIELLALDDGQRPRRGLIRSARKWGLDSWRGTPLGTTWFDEFVEPPAVARVLQRYEADALLCMEGYQAALDPVIATRMIAHQRENAPEATFVFTQAPPGLAGVVLHRQITAELIEQQWPLGLVLSYRPELPRPDPITRPMCMRVSPAIAQTAGRFLADTQHARESLRNAFAELGDTCDAEALCAWSRRPENSRAAALPVEIELELTTDDPLPDTRLRPRGRRVPQRGPADMEAVRRMVRQLGAYDDRLLVLGGHGDPLRHQDFSSVCREVRATGVCGLALVTPLVELSEEQLTALLEYRVDLIEVQLDANTPETYRLVQAVDAFDRVLANIERIEAARRGANCPQPILVPSIKRCAATQPEIESFFDRWIQQLGWAVIRGYSRFCGTLPADELLPLVAPVRGPCRRLATRLTLLADGRAVACSEDASGELSLGRWDTTPLIELWAGSGRRVIRESHSRLALESLPLCAACQEWFRP